MSNILTPAEMYARVWQTLLDATAQHYPELSPSDREVKAWEILAEATTGKRVTLTRNEQGDIVLQEDKT